MFFLLLVAHLFTADQQYVTKCPFLTPHSFRILASFMLNICVSCMVYILYTRCEWFLRRGGVHQLNTYHSVSLHKISRIIQLSCQMYVMSSCDAALKPGCDVKLIIVWWSAVAPLNCEILCGKSAVLSSCCLWSLWFPMTVWWARGSPIWFPQSSQAPRSLQTQAIAHIYANGPTSLEQICMFVYVTNIKRDKWPEHPLLFDTHMFCLSPKQTHRHARHSDH